MGDFSSQTIFVSDRVERGTIGPKDTTLKVEFATAKIHTGLIVDINAILEPFVPSQGHHGSQSAVMPVDIF